MENMPTEQIKDTEKQVKQGSQINTVNEVNKTEETLRKNEKVAAEEPLEPDAETIKLEDEILRKIRQIKFTNVKDRDGPSEIRI